METKTIIIITISVLIVGLTFLLIGVLGKHYALEDGKCEYGFFRLDGYSHADCENMNAAKAEEAVVTTRRDQRHEKEVADGNPPRYYCARVQLPDEDGEMRTYSACLPTKPNEFGQHYIPFTGELADETNSHPNYYSCQNAIGTNFSTCPAAFNDIVTYYPYWSDYINWGWYLPYGCRRWGCRRGCGRGGCGHHHNHHHHHRGGRGRGGTRQRWTR